MENSSMFKRIIQVTIIFIMMFILLAWFGQNQQKQECNEFAEKARLNPILMDKTFKAILSVKTIKDFYPYDPGHSIVLYKQDEDNSLMPIIDWKGIFNDTSYEHYVVVYQYPQKYKKEVQSGIVRLDMIENVYIGNTREGLRFIFKRTQQGDIDKNNYALEAECDLRGDRLRIIKIK